MHKFRTVLTVVATAGMVLGTMGAASAAGTTTSNETRAQFIQQLDESLGISPVYPATADYQDVPASNPYYGYIEAATQKGFVNGISAGMFGPNDPITRAEAAKILVEAYGAGAQATATSTTFTDNSSIPTALVGFVAEAAKLGLMKGFTNGSFGPEAYLTSAQETHLVAQLQAALSASFKITASSTDVAVGQIVTLASSSGGTTTFAVTGSNASSALLSGSSFVASAPGNYTVTGTTAGGATATVTIGVYGTAYGLKVSAPASVVANGASQNTVTVSVVDANGNVVGNNSDAITLAQTGVAFATGFTATEDAVNGVATFTLTSGTVGGATSTLTATDGAMTATSSVTAATQVATSLSVTPSSPYIEANASTGTDAVYVAVDDQTGNPMLYGTYGYSLAVTGPATFPGATTTYSGAYNGNGSATNAGTSTTLTDEQSVTGAVTVTATSSGLTSGSGTFTAVIAGAPAAVTVTAPSTTTVSEDNLKLAANELTYTVQVVDSHGYPVADAGYKFDVNVTNSSSTDVTANYIDTSNPDVALVGTQYQVTTGADGAATFSLYDKTAGPLSPNAGTYTVAVTDPAAVFASPATTSFTETAGVATQLAATAAGTYVPASATSDAISVQLEDAYGNPVAQAGVPVTFSSAAGNPYLVTLSSTQAATNASGVATVTASSPTYVGKTYTVDAASTGLGTSNASFTVEGTVATTMVATIQDTQTGSHYQNSLGQAGAGDQVTFAVYAKDQYGTPVTTNDSVTLTFSGTGAVTTPTALVGTVTDNGNGTYSVTLASGYAEFTATATTAGGLSVSAVDNSVASAPTGSVSFAVVPGGQATTPGGWEFFDASGNLISATNLLTVAANTPVEVWLKPVDAQGNPVVLSQLETVSLTATSGAYRLSSSGASVTSIPNTTATAGVGAIPVWYVNATAGSYNLNAITTFGYTSP